MKLITKEDVRSALVMFFDPMKSSGVIKIDMLNLSDLLRMNKCKGTHWGVKPNEIIECVREVFTSLDLQEPAVECDEDHVEDDDVFYTLFIEYVEQKI